MAQQSLEQINQSWQALQKRIQTEGITDNSGKVLVKPNAYNPATNIITAENLSNPPKQIDVKPFQEPPLPSGLNYNAPEIPQTQSAITPEMQSILDMYEKPTKPDYSAAYNASDAPAKETAFLESQKATKAAQAKLANINAQLQGLSLETQGKELQIGKEPISAGAIRGRNIEEERNLAIRSIPLGIQAFAAQAEIASAQGDEQIAQNSLAMANERLQTAFKIQTDYEDKLFQYNQNLIDKVYDFATKQQQIKLEENRLANERAYNEKQNQMKYAQQIALEAGNAGNWDLSAKIAGINWSQPNASQELYNLTSLIAPKVEKLDTSVVEVGGRKVLIDNQTGKTIKDLGIITGTGVGETGDGGTIIPSAQDSGVLDRLNVVNQLLTNPKLDNIFGPIKQFTGGIFGEAATAKNQFNQLKGQLSLDNRKLLKGSGAISDFESRTLEQAASALGRNLSPAEGRKQLAVIKGALQTAVGLTANVIVIDPKTGQRKSGQLDRLGINEAIASGYTVEYTE